MTTRENGDENTPENWAVHEGMDVLSSDGEKIGEVQDATGTYVHVRKGFIFKHDYYIPAAAIANVGTDAVYLTVTREIALEQGWESPPADDGQSSGPGVITADAAEVAAESTEPMTGTFNAPRALSSETEVDDRTGTYTDLSSGTQSVDPEESVTPVRDSRLSDIAEGTVASDAGVSVGREGKAIDPRLEPEPEAALERSGAASGPEDVGEEEAAEEPTGDVVEGRNENWTRLADKN